MSVDFTARKASNPGRKLTKIAAKGVWPLFVRPSVRLITSYSLRCASTNSVRLDTYSAEFLLDQFGRVVSIDWTTHAAVKAEKMKQASKKPGKTLIPAFWMAITNGDRIAVWIPLSRSSEYHEM